MPNGIFWDLFCETGDIGYYLLFKELGGRKGGAACGSGAAAAYGNSEDYQTAV